MATDKKIPSNLIFNKEKFRYDNIQDVINDTGLTVGLVVETDGYNTLGDGFGAKYLITNVNENGSIPLTNGYYAKEVPNSNGSKKVDKANTIEELKGMNLKVGDVIEVLGYYSADDGATHKRVIADTDDGSGVQLRSGKWANIIKSEMYYSNWFGANKSEDVTDIFKKMITYNKPLIINKGEYNLSEFIFDVERIIQEDNGIYSNKSIIRTEELPENKPLKKLIGMFDYNGIMTQRGHQSVAYNKNKQEYILGFSNTDDELSTLIFLDKNFSFIKKVNVDLGHCNGLTYNPKTNKLISGGYLGSTVKANQIFILNYDTLTIEKTVNLGYGLIGVSYDEEKDIYSAGSENVYSILDSDFNILKKITLNETGGISGATPQDTEFFNGNYLNYLDDGTSNIYITSADLKGNINKRYLYHAKGHYEPEGIFKLDKNTLLTTEYSRTTIQFFRFHFNKTSLNISDVNIPNSIIRFVDSNALKEGEGTANNPYKTIKYALLKNIGVPNLKLFLKGTFNENVSFEGAERVMIKKWGDTKPIVKGQFTFYGNPYIIIYDTVFQPDTGIDRLIFSQSTNFFLNKVDIIQPEPPKYRGIGLYRSLGTLTECTFKNCSTAIASNEASSAYVTKCSGTNNVIRYSVGGGFIIHHTDSFDNENDVIELGRGEIYPKKTQVSEINTLYHGEKMKEEGVYDDFITYMDEKTAYDKQQRKLEQDRHLAYEQALKENPELTYEEFMSVQPMTLNLIEEPQPSENLKKFMDKYL